MFLSLLPPITSLRRWCSKSWQTGTTGSRGPRTPKLRTFAGHRYNEWARVSASLTARPWHPSDCIRPLRVDHVISWKWKRAAPRRARDTITCTYKRYTCIIYMCIVLLHPSHPTAKIAMVVISCLIFACQRGACGIACQEPTIGARRKIVGGMGACSPCLFQELYTAICLCHKSFACTNLNITIDSLRLSIFKRLSHDKEYNNFADLHQRK